MIAVVSGVSSVNTVQNTSRHSSRSSQTGFSSEASDAFADASMVLVDGVRCLRMQSLVVTCERQTLPY